MMGMARTKIIELMHVQEVSYFSGLQEFLMFNLNMVTTNFHSKRQRMNSRERCFS